MATEWDIDNSFDEPLVDTQRTRVRPKTKTALFSVFAITAGALFCLNDAGVLSVEKGLASLPVISIQKVPRPEANLPKKPVRRERQLYAPDARDGLSTHRLAQTFSAVFTPVEEESAAVDFSFG